jgi:hypothetical protein
MRGLIIKRSKKGHCAILKYFLPPGNLFTGG